MTSLGQIPVFKAFSNAIPLAGIVLGLLCNGVKAEESPVHWSLRPISKANVPEDENPVDWFIEKQLEEAGITQNPRADRYTLLRRATLDLTGLPPTREEIAGFIENSEPDAFEKLVDRLLDSPHYGERWGRHWLDVARYVQGTIKVPGIDKIDLAEPYRDYVVSSFNEDKPYDQFITEQLAGDLIAELAKSEDEYFDRITAPAFLSIGQWYDECTDPNKLKLDIVDEQISTLTRAFLAMDFACSRCHDHKFDPIPTSDYYAMAGILRSTEITEHFAEEWKDGRPRAVRALVMPEEEKKITETKADLDALSKKRFSVLEKAKKRILTEQPDRKPIPLDTKIEEIEGEDFAGHKNLKITSFEDGEFIESRRLLDQWVKYKFTTPAEGSYVLLLRYASETDAPVELEINAKTLEGEVPFPATYGETAEHFRWTSIWLPDLKKGSNYVRFKVDKNMPFPSLDRLILTTSPSPLTPDRLLDKFWPPTIAEVEPLLTEKEKQELEHVDAQMVALRKELPEAEVTLAIRDRGKMIDLPVHVGGNTYQTKGDPVPRGVPSLAEAVMAFDAPVPDNESGRLQLAEWLTDPKHPLTARVMVNRIWHWHFGTGLVRTTDDFGKQGAPPTHPELLDWLASELIENDWSIKHLHRVIMNSATYQASSLETDENLERDGDGALLSRFPSRRLEVEAIYDSMLASTGKVARQESGNPLDTSLSKDRALYILTSSRSPMGLGMEIRKMFPLFGYDPSGRPIHDRDESITPNQGLWWLNNPLPQYYADKLAEQLCNDFKNDQERVQAVHEIILGRPANAQAEAAMLAYLSHNRDNKKLTEQEAWSRICLGLYSSRTFSHIE